MAKRSKTYRGQKKVYNPCGCFFCTGYDKDELHHIKKKEDLDNIKLIIDNFDLHNVSGYTVRCPDCMSSNIGGSYCYNCQGLMW